MKQNQNFIVKNLHDLESVADWLVLQLKPGDRIGLAGPLGAGKTTLTQLLATRLGVTDAVDSPTFTLRQSYRTLDINIPEVIHYDFYRLETPRALAEIGLEDDWQRTDSLLIIEWADRFPHLVDHYSYFVTIDFNQETDTREITIIAKEPHASTDY